MNQQSAIAPFFPSLIGGHAHQAETCPRIDVIDPSTGDLIAQIAACGAHEVDLAVQAARAAFDDGAWSKLTAVERGRLLHKLGAKITEHAAELAEWEAKDTGKPLSQAKADMVAAARYFEYYGAAADKVHGESIPFLSGYQVQTIYEPFGVTGHIIDRKSVV